MIKAKELLVSNGFVRIDQFDWKPVDKITYIKNNGNYAHILFDDGHSIDVCIFEGGMLPLLRKLRGEE